MTRSSFYVGDLCDQEETHDTQTGLSILSLPTKVIRVNLSSLLASTLTQATDTSSLKRMVLSLQI